MELKYKFCPAGGTGEKINSNQKGFILCGRGKLKSGNFILTDFTSCVASRNFGRMLAQQESSRGQQMLWGP